MFVVIKFLRVNFLVAGTSSVHRLSSLQMWVTHFGNVVPSGFHCTFVIGVPFAAWMSGWNSD